MSKLDISILHNTYTGTHEIVFPDGATVTLRDKDLDPDVREMIDHYTRDLVYIAYNKAIKREHGVYAPPSVWKRNAVAKLALKVDKNKSHIDDQVKYGDPKMKDKKTESIKVDPTCPNVLRAKGFYLSNRFAINGSSAEEQFEEWKRKHVKLCDRCRKYKRTKIEGEEKMKKIEEQQTSGVVYGHKLVKVIARELDYRMPVGGEKDIWPEFYEANKDLVIDFESRLANFITDFLKSKGVEKRGPKLPYESKKTEKQTKLAETFRKFAEKKEGKTSDLQRLTAEVTQVMIEAVEGGMSSEEVLSIREDVLKEF